MTTFTVNFQPTPAAANTNNTVSVSDLDLVSHKAAVKAAKNEIAFIKSTVEAAKAADAAAPARSPERKEAKAVLAVVKAALKEIKEAHKTTLEAEAARREAVLTTATQEAMDGERTILSAVMTIANDLRWNGGMTQKEAMLAAWEAVQSFTPATQIEAEQVEGIPNELVNKIKFSADFEKVDGEMRIGELITSVFNFREPATRDEAAPESGATLVVMRLKEVGGEWKEVQATIYIKNLVNFSRVIF